ncbi:MAG TPA: hypothetical protein VM901_11330 [Bdellovibrionota bacterium]|jgi:hypothetical protein|nr:hypothetical protein [Bdellovibrionota bacterium]
MTLRKTLATLAFLGLWSGPAAFAQDSSADDTQAEARFEKWILEGRQSWLSLYSLPQSEREYDLGTATQDCAYAGELFLRDEENDLAPDLRIRYCEQYRKILSVLGISDNDIESDYRLDTYTSRTLLTLKVRGENAPKNIQLWELFVERYEKEVLVSNAIKAKGETGTWRDNRLMRRPVEAGDDVAELAIEGMDFSAYVSGMYSELKDINAKINKIIEAN